MTTKETTTLRNLCKEMCDTQRGFTSDQLTEYHHTVCDLFEKKYKVHLWLDSYYKWTKLEKRADEFRSVREMVNSCLIYDNGTLSSFYNENTKQLVDYGVTYRDEYCAHLTEKEIIETALAQKERFKNAKIIVGCGTDSEGCVYNGVDWN